jgi:hypothetical protein
VSLPASKISFFLLFLCGFLLAQSDRGTITGTVSDPAGAVVANAPIEARNLETGAVYQVGSTATGNYTIGQLPAGNYEVSVTVPGFKRYVHSGLTVEVAQTLRIDIPLEVGSASDVVTVTSEAPLLKTESGELSHTIEAQRLNDLPVLGIGGTFSSSQGIRFYLSQTQLVPGTYFSSGANGLRVNGAPNNSQRMQIEGMDATNALISFSQASMQPSVDAIQETAVQTSNYSAEFGQVGGGLLSITARSGTNSYHGAGYDYLANEAFNASTPFVNTNPRIRRNDYGFNLGGPVILPKLYSGRDRTFFFYNREQYREFFVVNNLPITVPTDQYRLGNFASLIPAAPRTLGNDPLGNKILEGMIYDPNTTAAASNGQVYRLPFQGNIIPASRFDKVAVAIQKLIPPVNIPGRLSSNFLPSYPNDRVTTNESVKIDHQLSSRAKLSGYWGTNATRAQYSQQLNGSEGLPAPITATRGTFTASYTWRVNFDETLSPTLLLHVGAGFVYYPFSDNAPVTDYDQVAQLGLNGATVNGAKGGRFPSITGLCQTGTSPLCIGNGGMANMGPVAGGLSTQSHSNQTTPTFNSSLIWVKENHTYKFGGEVRLYGFVGHYLSGTNGLYNFAADQTGQPFLNASQVGGANIGFGYASFLLGLVNNGTINFPADVRTGKQQWGFFAQDTWKVTRRLTLDYGLRYDYSTYPREQYGRIPTLAPTLANPSVGGEPGAVVFEGSGIGRCNCSFGKNYPWAFGPRLGVAYQITPKTVFRAGFGVAYDGTATGFPGQNYAASNNNFTNPGFGLPALQLQSGIPSNFYTPFPDLIPGLYPNPLNPTALNGPPVVVDQNAGRPGRQMQWSVGLQREIFPNLLVEASYVGNRGAWWQSTTLDNYNALTPQILSNYGLDINSATDRAILRAPIGSSVAGRFQNKVPYAGFPLTSTVAQALRPFPQFSSGLTPLWAPEGRTWYDSLQAKVTKRYSHGLDLSYAFTWSKELQMGTEVAAPAPTLPASVVVNDVFNRKNDKYISSFSRPLVSVLAANYRLPSWGANKIVSHLVRDWTLGAVLQYASGLPIPAPASNNRLSTLLFQNTLQTRVPGVPLFLKDMNCHCIDPNKDLVLNPAAWTDAPDGQFGTAALYYNDYRYQRRPSEAMSFGRTFQFKERMALAVRMEFTNIFNRTQLANPSVINPTAQINHDSLGNVTGGFGFITPASTFAPPRQGTLVARFSF